MSESENHNAVAKLMQIMESPKSVGMIIVSVEQEADGGIMTDVHEFTNNRADAVVEAFVSALADLFYKAQAEEIPGAEQAEEGVTWN